MCQTVPAAGVPNHLRAANAVRPRPLCPLLREALCEREGAPTLDPVEKPVAEEALPTRLP